MDTLVGWLSVDNTLSGADLSVSSVDSDAVDDVSGLCLVAESSGSFWVCWL